MILVVIFGENNRIFLYSISQLCKIFIGKKDWKSKSQNDKCRGTWLAHLGGHATLGLEVMFELHVGCRNYFLKMAKLMSVVFVWFLFYSFFFRGYLSLIINIYYLMVKKNPP